MADRCGGAVGSCIGKVHAGVIMACIARGIGCDYLLADLGMFAYERGTEVAGAGVAVGTGLCRII